MSRYIDELLRLKAAAREEGSAYLTWNDIQACVDQVNNAVQEEHESESHISYSPRADQRTSLVLIFDSLLICRVLRDRRHWTDQ